MKNKEKKEIQKTYVNKNIEYYFSLLENRLEPKYDSVYIKEILNLSKSFNQRLTRKQKLKFCKKCHSLWNVETKEVRINPKNSCIEHICKNCGSVRRFKFK